MARTVTLKSIPYRVVCTRRVPCYGAYDKDGNVEDKHFNAGCTYLAAKLVDGTVIIFNAFKSLVTKNPKGFTVDRPDFDWKDHVRDYNKHCGDRLKIEY